MNWIEDTHCPNCDGPEVYPSGNQLICNQCGWVWMEPSEDEKLEAIYRMVMSDYNRALGVRVVRR